MKISKSNSDFFIKKAKRNSLHYILKGQIFNKMNEDELSLEFNDKDYTAKVVNSPYAYGDILIPKIVKYGSNDYIITSISKYAFKDNKNIKSIKFSADSKLTLIEKNAFYGSSIESIYLPPSVNEIEEGWCNSTPKLTTITVSPENSLYQFYDDKFLLKKSQKDKEEYDVLLFARRDIKQGTIPPFISHICQYCFCDCKGLESIQFSEESKLKSISKNSFFKSPITSIQIPPNLEKLEEGWCKGCLKLTEIILSPKNKNFLYLDDQFLIQ